MYGTLLANGGLRVEREHCYGIVGLSDYHQERTSPTYSQRKNNPRQLHPHPQKQLWQEAVQTIPWPAMSPDMNPIEQVWDFIGRKINQRNPKCQNVTMTWQNWGSKQSLEKRKTS
jgi:hypothetical protein